MVAGVSASACSGSACASAPRSAISRFNEAEEIRIVAPLARSPFSGSSSGAAGCGTAAAGAQPAWKPELSGGAGTGNAGPTGGAGGGGGIAVPFAGVGGGEACADAPDAPDEFWVYQAGGA